MSSLKHRNGFNETLCQLRPLLHSTGTQGRRKHLKLGAHDTSRALFSVRKREHFLEIKRALLCLLQIFEGTCFQCPPVSYVYAGTYLIR